jgi:hypothetical protein
MSFASTVLFYGLLGAGIAVATCLRDEHRPLAERVYHTFAAFLFWPLFVPLLFEGVSHTAGPKETPPNPETPADSFS